MARKLLQMLTLPATVTAVLAVVDKEELKFTATVGSDTVCDETGKPRKFADVDAFVKAVIDQNPFVTSIEITMDVTGVKEPKIPTDPLKSAQGTFDKWTVKKAKLVARQAYYVSFLAATAAWQTSPIPTYAAAYADAAAIKAAVDAMIAFADTVLAEAQAIIDASE